MSDQNPNSASSDNEEVDLIKLLNYFKNGIKSIFRWIWKGFELIFQFIALLRKKWIIVLALTVAGIAYGWYIKNYVKSDVMSCEMVVKSNPISNIELYAFSSEVNNQNDFSTSSEGKNVAKKLGIRTMIAEPIVREVDVVNSYFDQVENITFRGDQTDTLYYQASELGKYKGSVSNEDYTLQRVKLIVNKNNPTAEVQEGLLQYLNNLAGPKKEQENKLAVLTSYERILKQSLNSIDSLMVSRATLNKNSGPAGTEQLLVNTASRGNVEADLLRYSEIMSRKLYGTQKKIAEYQNGINVVSNLRLIKDENILSKPMIKYGLLGFLLAAALILLLQFNKFLSKYQPT